MQCNIAHCPVVDPNQRRSSGVAARRDRNRTRSPRWWLRRRRWLHVCAPSTSGHHSTRRLEIRFLCARILFSFRALAPCRRSTLLLDSATVRCSRPLWTLSCWMLLLLPLWALPPRRSSRALVRQAKSWHLRFSELFFPLLFCAFLVCLLRSFNLSNERFSHVRVDEVMFESSTRPIPLDLDLVPNHRFHLWKNRWI